MKINSHALKLAMINACMDTPALAETAGVSAQTINKVLRGVGGSRKATIGKIARSLNVDPAELIEQET